MHKTGRPIQTLDELLPDNADPQIVSPHPTLYRLAEQDTKLYKPPEDRSLFDSRNPFRIAENVTRFVLSRLIDR